VRPWICGPADDVITISADMITGYQMIASPGPVGVHGADLRP
jgi:hypothetical protein